MKKKITDYTPDPANPNKHTERGVSMLENSMHETGLGRSIVVDKNGVIIAGNSTQERAVDLGFEDAIEVETDGKQLVVVKRTDLDLLSDDQRARLLSYYDNRTSEVSLEWNPEQLLADVNAGLDLHKLFSELELQVIFDRHLIHIPTPSEQLEPQLKSDVLIEIRCSNTRFKEFQHILNQWSLYPDVTVDVS